MSSPAFYATQEAYERQCAAAREAYSRQSQTQQCQKSEVETIIDADFYEIDSVSGLIECKPQSSKT